MSSSREHRREPSHSRHVPVLLREVIQNLDLQPGHVVVDGTLGAGGHAAKILERIGDNGILIGLDRDQMMIDLAKQNLPANRVVLRHASYCGIANVLAELEIDAVDRILLDLGLSSDQLADDSRGFSYESAGPLDLRFDTSIGEPASQLLDRLEMTELAEILEQYGEEPFNRQIAAEICRRRPLRTTTELVEAVLAALPATARQSAKKHPATRTIQALRIAVNDELAHVETAIKGPIYDSLKSGGKLAVISFHSLEDRIVKREFQGKTRWKNLTPKPVTATSTEIKFNPRSRTAKLRVATKL